MGVEEVEAYEAVAAILELAVAAGRLRPGTRGWRIHQVEIAGEYLRAANPDPAGGCRLDRIRAERIGVWARSRGQARRRSLAGVVGRLARPLPVPSDADEYLAPLRWLLEHAGTPDGLPLTGTHGLDRAVAAEAHAWFGSDGGGTGEGRCLRALREMTLSMGAVRRTGRRLVLTATGRRLLANPQQLWTAAASCLIGAGDTAQAAVAEAALVVLVDGRPIGREELTRAASGVLTSEGAGDAQVPAVRAALAALSGRLQALGLLADERWLRPLRLPPIGQAAALSALQARATRPRHAIGFG